MSWIRRSLARAATTIRGHDAGHADLQAEMQAHLEMATDENIRRGMTPGEARRQALLEAGGLTQAAERVHEARGVSWLEGLVADGRYALRRFRRTPLATLTMLLVLSLGIGVNVVLFTLLNSIATMPAPGIERNDALVRIRGSSSGVGGVQPRLLSWPEVQEFASERGLFASVAAYTVESAAVQTGTGESTLTASLIYTTANYFQVLGVRAAAGSPPGAGSGVELAGAPTAMISDGMWQQLGGGRDVVGRTVRINDIPVEIVGIAPPRFTGTEGRATPTLWLSLGAYPQIQRRSPAVFASTDTLFLEAAARLQPGVSEAGASAAVAAIAGRLDAGKGRRGETGPVGAPPTGAGANVVPMLASNSRPGDRRDAIQSGLASGGFALLVLLITCTNVSALMVGLAVSRRPEIGVRLALGAPRRRLIRQLLTESVVLALMAGLIGLMVTFAGIRLLGAALADVQLAVDWRVTAATCLVAVVTGVLMGISPALHATRVSVGEVLKSSATSGGGTRSRMQRGLVVAQIALTQPLLLSLGVVIAALFADGSSPRPVRVGEQLVEIEVDAWAGRVSPDERAARIDAAVGRVAALPGVSAAMPLQLGTVSLPVAVHPADRVAGAGQTVVQTTLAAAPEGYFGALEIPVVRGRDFTPGERAHTSHDDTQPVAYDAVIVGRDVATRLWGGADPLGRRLVVSLPPPNAAVMVVVGVVDERAAGPGIVNDQMRVFVPYGRMNDGILARTAGPALPLMGTMRRVVAAEVPQMPVVRVQTVAQREAQARRALLRASGAAAVGGVLALLLSAVGLYAVVSLLVSQRTREIGIRTALGAPTGQVVRMFFARGLGLGGAGLLLGLPLSILATRLIRDTLTWPMASTPLLGAAIGLVVLAVASVAAWIPARRASRIDPMLALRGQTV